MPHHGDLYRRALRFEGSRVAASDLTQDTLERALRRFQAFRTGSNVRAWLFTIMYHLFCDERRRSRQSLEAIGPGDAGAEPESAPPWQNISSDVLQRAVQGLDLGQREVVERRWAQGNSYQRISQELGIPLGTVGTRLLRAHRRLRDVLDRPCANG
jgi:RNA polymerase sigma-70 factor (ECF subfamily)